MAVYIFQADNPHAQYLCTVGKSIMALKAAREGPRNILIVSSRTNHINVRDARTGLLLRTIEVPDKITIYSILLDGGIIHCGTNQNKIISYEFSVSLSLLCVHYLYKFIIINFFIIIRMATKYVENKLVSVRIV